MPTALPSLFLSHGSPMVGLQPGAAGAFMKALGPRLVERWGRPRAILAVSAHTLARQPRLLAAARHAAVHDFGGFDPRLYELRYDVAGAPALAATAAGLIEAAGMRAVLDGDGSGLDHGLWIPLRYLFPEADIAVLPLAFSPRATPADLFALGQALAPLRGDGVLVMASGGITHNLRLFFDGPPAAVDAPEIEASRAFRDWVWQRSRSPDWPALFDYRAQAPQAVAMHPTDEHWLPWYVAAGAGGVEATPQRIFDGVMHGVLGMDAYAFGDEAADLA